MNEYTARLSACFFEPVEVKNLCIEQDALFCHMPVANLGERPTGEGTSKA
jgi:hypothetical protein